MSATVQSAAALADPSLFDADARTTHPETAARAALTLVPTSEQTDVEAQRAEILARIDRDFTTDGGDPNVIAFVDYFKELVAEADDPAAMVEHISDVIIERNAELRLERLLAKHHITQVPADGAQVTEPTFVGAYGRRFLTVPDDADPAETLEFVRQAFASQEQDAGSTPRTWVRRIHNGGQIIETCPTWCTAHHENDQQSNLDDLTHHGDDTEMHAAVFDPQDDTVEVPILRATIAADPYSEDPARSAPHISFEPFQDEVMECLSPEEFAAVIARIRAHCDRLDEVHAQLVQARAEWNGQQPADTEQTADSTITSTPGLDKVVHPHTGEQIIDVELCTLDPVDGREHKVLSIGTGSMGAVELDAAATRQVIGDLSLFLDHLRALERELAAAEATAAMVHA